MTGRTWGAALTAGLAAGALGLVCLLGAVLHSAALPVDGSVVSWKDGPAPPARSVPVRSPEKNAPPRDRPPVRLWHGPTFEKHPPKARKALA